MEEESKLRQDVFENFWPAWKRSVMIAQRIDESEFDLQFTFDDCFEEWKLLNSIGCN